MAKLRIRRRRRLVAIGNNLGERLGYDVDTRAIAPPSASRTPAAAWCASSNGPTTSGGCSVRSAPAADHAASPTTSTTIRSASLQPAQFAHSQAFDALDRLVGRRSSRRQDPTRLRRPGQPHRGQDPRGVTTATNTTASVTILARLVSPDSGTTPSSTTPPATSSAAPTLAVRSPSIATTPSIA
ncbi:hypothetical protein P4129_05175 [Pseudomonas aeruginosa]|nr:hypothetical protein [Pseudomonas aeruginosa]